MAKVKTEKLRFAGRLIQRVVNFDAKRKRFTSLVPDEVARATGEKEVSGATLDECLAAWNQAVETAKRASIERRRVIRYEITRDGIVHRDGQRIRIGPDHSSWRYADPHGLELKLRAGVYDEEAVTLGGQKRFEYVYVESSIPATVQPTPRHSYGTPVEHAVDWTPEREAWFAGLVRAFEDILLRLDAAFADKDQLLERIAAGRLLEG